MDNSTVHKIFDIIGSSHGVTLARLMLFGNTLEIEKVLPQAHQFKGQLSENTGTRLTLLASMHEQAIVFLDHAELALRDGTQPMLVIAGEILDQTEDLLLTMIHLLVPPDAEAPFDFSTIWEDFMSRARQACASGDPNETRALSGEHSSLMLIQQLAWCLDVVFLAHNKLADESYDAIAEHEDEDGEEGWSPVLSYHDLPVVHQGAHGIIWMLINLKHALKPGNNHKQAYLVRDIKKSVDSLVATCGQLPTFILPSSEGGFALFGDPWSESNKGNPAWLENHIVACSEMLLKLEKLKASGRTPQKAEDRLELSLCSLATWIAEAEKQQSASNASAAT